MSKLNERILKRYKDNIAISNLKEECVMKKNTIKKITTFSLMGIVLVFGSFFTVNAATGGELVDNFKTGILKIIKIRYVDADDYFDVNTDISGDVMVDEDNFTKIEYKVAGSGEVSTGVVTYKFEGGLDGGEATAYIIED